MFAIFAHLSTLEMSISLLFMLSEEDTVDKDVMIYNPFTRWGELIYMKRHKEFYKKNNKK